MSGVPAVRLACAVPPATPDDVLAPWARILAPHVTVRTAADPGADDLPLALFGAHDQAVTALAVAERRTAAGRAPCALLVCDCPAPPSGGLDCPVVALAGRSPAREMAGWRAVTTGDFVVRVLGGAEPPPHGRPSRAVALLLQEELRVWPY
ncbi:hypothetical protein [Saccharopolyspora rosea]|uniref:Uncharacterized protein n=1 Tax=Saccharopolyspora rosea TaxID=524884 RepID=A0ABW3FWC2_9PSEU|nr:hypothetical protein [Saccharopolyspora rosea]